MPTPRTILLTGATSGLGRALALELAAEPSHLIVHGRNPSLLAELSRDLADVAHPDTMISTVQADFTDLAKVRTLADDVAGLTAHLDVLVNNAGIGSGPRTGGAREFSADGHELRLAVNHLASFALTLHLLPLLAEGAPSRVVHVASGAQEPLDLDDLNMDDGYSGSRAYAQSKLAMITTGLHLAERLDPEQTTVNSLHPATLMPTKMVEEGWGYTIDNLSDGVTATLHLIRSKAVDGVSGRYYSGRTPTRALPEAYDPEIQTRLWELSEQLTGTRFSSA